MTIELKLCKIGEAVGLVLPEDALAKLKAGEGDTVYLTDAPGGLRLTVGGPEFARTMAVAEDISRRYANTLRELAK